MVNNTFLFISVFLLIMAVLNVVKNLYAFAKVMSKQEGKFESDTLSTVLLGCSISYIIATLIVGL